jgi:ElaB/YqjD/DUF883 family membrane-anchored ribosome-binding protein
MTQQKTTYPIDYTDGSRTAKSGQDLADSASDRIKEAADTALETAGRVAEQARDYGEKAQEAVQSFKPFVEKSLKEQPMATLAVVSLVGFVLGALWKK